MISETGIWGEEEAVHHQHSANLAAFMAGYFPKDKRVYDFGCGLGYYVKHLHDAGFDVYGIEGARLKNNLCDNRILVGDLTNPLSLPNGSVISLEVGEHIPKQYEQRFIDNLTKCCNDKLVMSWALPNQPGIGHVNCQPREYIISEIERRGFVYMESLTEEVMTTIEDNCNWFQRTLLIFRRAV